MKKIKKQEKKMETVTKEVDDRRKNRRGITKKVRIGKK